MLTGFALELTGEAPPEQRTITNLITQVQDAAVRDGLTPYSLAGRSGLWRMQFMVSQSKPAVSRSKWELEKGWRLASRDFRRIALKFGGGNRREEELSGC